MPGGDDLGVVLPVERGRPEVDEPDLRVLDPADVLPLLGVVDDLPVGGDEQDVLGLQIGVGQLALVEVLDGVAQLEREELKVGQYVHDEGKKSVRCTWYMMWRTWSSGYGW